MKTTMRIIVLLLICFMTMAGCTNSANHDANKNNIISLQIVYPPDIYKIGGSVMFRFKQRQFVLSHSGFWHNPIFGRISSKSIMWAHKPGYCLVDLCVFL